MRLQEAADSERRRSFDSQAPADWVSTSVHLCEESRGDFLPILVKRLLRALRVRTGEGRLIALVAGLGFLISTGGSVGGNAVDALFFSRFGVANLPPLYVALGISTLFTTLLLSGLVSRGARGRLYVSIALVLAIVLLVERGLLALGESWVYPVIWLAMNLMGSVQGLLMWGLAALVCDTRQAKRLFPIVGAAGVLGGVVGGLATRPLAGVLHVENLLLVWSACLLGGFALGLLVLRLPATAEGPARGGSFVRDIQRGFQVVRTEPLLRWLAVAAVLFSVLFFSLSFAFARAVTQHFPKADALAGFLGLFQAASTAAAFLASLVLGNRIYARIGLMTAVLALPALYMAGFGALAVIPAFGVLVGFRFLQMAYLFGVAGTAYHAVFNVVPGERREQARAFIEGVGSQAGIVLGGLFLLVGQHALQPGQVYVGGLVLAGLTLAAVWASRRQYAGALLAALREGQPDIFTPEPHPLGGVPRDARAMTVVLDSLASKEASVRRVAVEIAAQLELQEAVPRLAELVDDPDPGVSAAAAGATGNRDRLREMARAADPTTRAAAVRALGEHPEAEDADLLAQAGRDASAAVRRAAAGGLARAAPELALNHLLPLLAEADPSVRSAAADAVADLGVRVQAELLAALADPRRENAALAGLERLPSPAPGQVADHISRRSAEALELSRQAAAADSAGEPAALLARSLRSLAEQRAVQAVRVAGLLAERQAAAAAVRGLQSGVAAQRANALEALESLPPRAHIRPLVEVWEPAERAADDGWLEPLLQHGDAWIRECAVLAAAARTGGDSMKTLETLPPMERIVFLSRVPLFAALPPADLEQVAAVASEHLFTDGETLVREGQPGGEMYIIVTGGVSVVHDGREVAVRRPGDHVGEQAILTGATRNATLVAVGETRTLVIDRAHFESILRERPETALAVIRTLSDRLREVL